MQTEVDLDKKDTELVLQTAGLDACLRSTEGNQLDGMYCCIVSTDQLLVLDTCWRCANIVMHYCIHFMAELFHPIMDALQILCIILCVCTHAHHKQTSRMRRPCPGHRRNSMSHFQNQVKSSKVDHHPTIIYIQQHKNTKVVCKQRLLQYNVKG